MKNDYLVYSGPLQGFTDDIWRTLHSRVFGGVDAYYAPFMRVDHGSILKRDIRDVLPENNEGFNLVPQILGCSSSESLLMVNNLKELGYSHIDINLGCPHPPIALHQKGSGLLAHPKQLETILNDLSKVDGVTYSVKMRLGYDDSSQWKEVLPILSEINPTHIVVHPRIGKQLYKGDLYEEEFNDLLSQSRFRVLYNGDICSLDDAAAVREKYPAIAGVMIGRGLVANPALLTPGKATKENYIAFHESLFDAYRQRLSGGDKQVLMKMKSFWELFLPNESHKAHKAIKKASNLTKYEAAVGLLFNEMEIN